MDKRKGLSDFDRGQIVMARLVPNCQCHKSFQRAIIWEKEAQEYSFRV